VPTYFSMAQSTGASKYLEVCVPGGVPVPQLVLYGTGFVESC
jgi:hypothetical protein